LFCGADYLVTEVGKQLLLIGVAINRQKRGLAVLARLASAIRWGGSCFRRRLAMRMAFTNKPEGKG
jgi:hypothetical protein